MSIPAELVLPAAPPHRSATLWLGAAVCVLSAHLALGLAFRALTPSQPPQAAEQALEIELSPVFETTPEAVESDSIVEKVPVDDLTPVAPEEVETAETLPPEQAEPVERLEAIQPDPVETIQPETETLEAVQPEREVTEPVPVEPEPEPQPDENAEIVPAEPDILPDLPPEVAVPVERPDVVLPVVPKPQRVERRKEPVRPAIGKKPPARVAEGKPKPKSDASIKRQAATAPDTSLAQWRIKTFATIYGRAGRNPTSRAGRVGVQFTVSASGSIGSVQVVRPSGVAALDRAAVQAVRRTGRVAPPPEGSTTTTMTFSFQAN